MYRVRQLKAEMRSAIEDEAHCYRILCNVHEVFTVVTLKRKAVWLVTRSISERHIASIFSVEVQFTTWFCRFLDWLIAQGNMLVK
jgi:hypothetical protein